MSIYRTLRQNPPNLKVKENAKEIYLHTVSCMCDNKHKLRLKKNESGEFKLSGCGFALSNWHMEYDKYEIEWAADENRWDTVISMINSGTEVIEKIVSR
jgi:hypothetical protein